MLDLSNHSLADTIPSSIKNDIQVQNAIKAIDDKLKDIHTKSSLVLFMPHLDELSEAMVDELAWQFHVDFYDSSADIEKKRELVRKSIKWHRIKGTPAAVEEVVTAAFKSARVQEWYEYGGQPYHFKVDFIEEPLTDPEVANMAFKAIEDTKNTRSWCDGISFIREVYQKSYIGIAIALCRTVTIKPTDFKLPDLNQKQYVGMAHSIFRTINIIPPKVEMPDFFQKTVFAGACNVYKEVNIK